MFSLGINVSDIRGVITSKAKEIAEKLLALHDSGPGSISETTTVTSVVNVTFCHITHVAQECSSSAKKFRLSAAGEDHKTTIRVFPVLDVESSVVLYATRSSF